MASLYETTTTSENETKPASNKKRSKPWEEKEEITLIVEVINREQLLFGELKGPGSKSIQRKRADGWSEIVDILNSRFMTAKRDVEEAKKKFFNLKQRCKETIDRIRRAMSQTGGGPPPPELTPAEQLIWKSMSERPVMTGLSVTIDTDATTELATPAEKEASTSSRRHENSQENTAECDGEQLSLSSEVTSSKIKKRRSQQVLTMVNTEKDTERIELETQKIQKEIEMMDREVELLICKKTKLEMEKDKLKSERELYEFKKIYYQLKVEKEFGIFLQSEQ